MTYRLFFEILFIISTPGLLSICNGQCTAGQFLYGPNECKECPPGSYMNISIHSFNKCTDCSTPKGTLYDVQLDCNSTHNTVFRCASNSFNSNGPELVCHECRVCVHVVRNCSSEEDTICCPHGDMILQELMDNIICETNSIDNHKYCCITKTPFFSTTNTSLIQISKVPGSISFDTEVEVNSSLITTLSAQLNTSPGPESNTNSSYIGKEEINLGCILAISIGCALGVIILVILVVFCICKRKRNSQDGKIKTDPKEKGNLLTENTNAEATDTV